MPLSRQDIAAPSTRASSDNSHEADAETEDNEPHADDLAWIDEPQTAEIEKQNGESFDLEKYWRIDSFRHLLSDDGKAKDQGSRQQTQAEKEALEKERQRQKQKEQSIWASSEAVADWDA